MLTAALKSKTQAIYQNILFRQASVLLLGKVGAQLLALLSYPILTRWYTPEQFGEFAFVNSLLALLLIMANGRYPAAIVLSKNRMQAGRLFQLSQLILLVYVGVLALALMLPAVHQYLQEQSHSLHLLWALPVLVLFGGYWQIVQNWLLRFEEYQKLSIAFFLQRLLILLGSVLAFYVAANSNGLIWGLLIGSCCTFILAIYYQRKPLQAPIRQLMRYANSYRDFPLYAAPSQLINLFTLHLPVLWLSFFHGAADAGYFSLAFTLISVPLTCYEVSFGQVFYQRMAQSPERERFPLFKNYFLHFGCLLLLALLITFFFSEILIVYLLGEDWRMAGKIVGMLGPLLLSSGIISLFTVVLIVYRKQKLLTFFHLAKLLLWVLALGLGTWLEHVNYSYMLLSFSSLILLFYLGVVVAKIFREKRSLNTTLP